MEEGTKQPSQSSPAKQADIKSAAIRTMKTDMEKLFKESRPNLAQMMGEHKETHPTANQYAISSLPRTSKSLSPLTLISFILLIVAALGAVWYFYFYPFSPSSVPPPPPTTETPAALFYTEHTQTITGDINTPVLILQQIEDIIQTSEGNGTFVYTPIKLRGTENDHYATAEEFFKLYGAKPPTNLLISIGNTVMPFVYYSSEGARFGFVLKSRDLPRTLQSMIAWEPSLLGDTVPLFFKETIAATTVPFESRAFRNIDWRYLNLSQDKDLGIAYSLFPSKGFLVITTSQDTMETVINRFYEGI